MKHHKKEIKKEIFNMSYQYFTLKIQLKNGQFKKTHILKKIRRNIAKLNTLLHNEKQKNEK